MVPKGKTYILKNPGELDVGTAEIYGLNMAADNPPLNEKRAALHDTVTLGMLFRGSGALCHAMEERRISKSSAVSGARNQSINDITLFALLP